MSNGGMHEKPNSLDEVAIQEIVRRILSVTRPERDSRPVERMRAELPPCGRTTACAPSPPGVLLARGRFGAGGTASQIRRGAMSFPKDIVDLALVAAGRCCCICHKLCSDRIYSHP